MLHEIGSNIFNNQYKEIFFVNEDDFILYYQNEKILLKRTEGGYEIPRSKDFIYQLKDDELIYAYSLNENSCFLLNDYDENIHNEHGKFIFEDIMFLRNFSKQEMAWIGSVGIQLYKWYRENKYCGFCGNRMAHKEDERAMKCDSCSNVVYPRISPAVIVAITHGDNILLAKGKNFRGNFYSLVAGFVEIGETFEEAAVREVKEEVGIDIKNLRYFASQPWPFSSSMMIGYFAEADINQKIKIDETEILEAKWYKRGNLPVTPNKISIAGEMIELFEKNKI